MCRPLDLRQAIIEIARTYWNRTRGDAFASPYVLVLGAGISAPIVPLASELIALFREEIAQLGLAQPPEHESRAQTYYECANRAYPTAELRRDRFRELTHDRPISPANLMTARLLGEGGLSTVAITTNFDRMLSRALGFLGRDFQSLDHPSTIRSRFNLARRDIQVLEIHGTYQHFDFCNLDEEIQDRAAALEHLLYSIFASRCPIVVGYSGWEDDAIMKALRRRLTEAPGSMAAGLFWFCYTQADAEALPEWLKNDPSVRIVAPHAETGVSFGTLPAEEVFTALIQGLERQAQDAARVAAKPLPAIDLLPLERIRLAECALQDGDLHRAQRWLFAVEPAALTPRQHRRFSRALQSLYERCWKSEAALALEACRLWEAVTRLRGGKRRSVTIAERAHAIYGQGLSLFSLGRYAEAKDRLDDVLAICASGGGKLAGRRAHATNLAAACLFQMGRSEEALVSWYHEGLVRDLLEDSETREARVFAHFNLALALKKLNRLDEAAVHWRELVARAWHADSDGRQVLVRAQEELFALERSGAGAPATPATPWSSSLALFLEARPPELPHSYPEIAGALDAEPGERIASARADDEPAVLQRYSEFLEAAAPDVDRQADEIPVTLLDYHGIKLAEPLSVDESATARPESDAVVSIDKIGVINVDNFDVAERPSRKQVDEIGAPNSAAPLRDPLPFPALSRRWKAKPLPLAA